MKLKIIFFFLILFISKSFSQEVVKVDPSDKKQIIKGWGVSLCWWANIMGDWNERTINEVAKIATDPKQLNLNVFRFNIGGGDDPTHNHMRSDGGNMPGYRDKQDDNQAWGTWNPENDYRQIKVMNALANGRILKEKDDIITELFSNSPPYWMTYSGCSAGSTHGYDNLHWAYYDDFADYLATVAKNLDNAYPNWNVKYIAPFNEPLSNWWKSGGGQEGCYVYPSTQASVLWHLWSRMTNYGIWGDIKLTAPDCNRVDETLWNIWYLWQYHNGEYNGLSKINTHSYFGNWQQKAELRNSVKNSGKELWQSESGPIGVDWTKAHYVMAYRQIEDLRNLECDVWCDWQLVSTTDQWSLLKFDIEAKTFEKTKSYYTRSHINRFIKQGYQVIANSNGCFLTALAPDSSKLIIVVANQDDVDKNYKIDLSGFESPKKYVMYRTTGLYTSEGENLKDFKPEKINNKQFDYACPGRSVTTFVVTFRGLDKADDDEADENVNTTEAVLPTEFCLKQNYPNPFNPSTELTYDISENGHVSLQVFDIQGRLIQTLINDYQNAGTYRINWNTSNLNLSSGMYYARLISGSNMKTIKMTLLK